MLVKVVGFSQEMDFEDGGVTNFVTLQLQNGVSLKAVISDDGARQLVEARASSGGFTAPPEESEEVREDVPETTDDDGAVVFGSNDMEEEPSTFWPGSVAQEAQAPPPAQTSPVSPYTHADPSVQQRLYQKHQVEMRKKKKGPSMGRTVPKDSMGYPMPPSNGGVDPRDVVGGGAGGVDEDGVGQF